MTTLMTFSRRCSYIWYALFTSFTLKPSRWVTIRPGSTCPRSLSATICLMWVVGSPLRAPVVGMMVACLSSQRRVSTGTMSSPWTPNTMTVPNWRTSRKTASSVSDGVGGPEVFGPLQAVLQQVDRDHLPRPLHGGEHGERQANGSLAHNQDALAQDAPHPLAGVEHGACWLAHDPLRQVAMVRQGDQPARGGGEVLRQASHASARQDDDPLPHMEGVRLALHDHAGTLMAWSADLQRVMLLGIPRPIAMANVAAADRHPLELDEALAILDRRHVHLDELEELATYQLRRFHTSFHLPQGFCYQNSRTPVCRSMFLPMLRARSGGQ
jgi:hypothetical protein